MKVSKHQGPASPDSCPTKVSGWPMHSLPRTQYLLMLFPQSVMSSPFPSQNLTDIYPSMICQNATTAIKAFPQGPHLNSLLLLLCFHSTVFLPFCSANVIVFSNYFSQLYMHGCLPRKTVSSANGRDSALFLMVYPMSWPQGPRTRSCLSRQEEGERKGSQMPSRMADVTARGPQ